MIIVNQDKESIANFSNAEGIFIDNTEIKIATKRNNVLIGTYETKERAKEVLHEIVNEYKTYLKLDGGPALIRGGLDIQPNVFNVPKVYEMPKE